MSARLPRPRALSLAHISCQMASPARARDPSTFDPCIFSALVNLLRLHTGGTLGSSFGGTDPDEDIASDEESLDAEEASLKVFPPLASSDRDELKRSFLDRFAEFASYRKGAWFVTCSALEESARHVEILLACNEGFGDEAESYLREVFAKLLMQLSDSHESGMSNAVMSSFR